MDRASADWYADESLWAETYPFMFPDRSFAEAAEQVGQLIQLSSVEEGSLLDVGCGPGRYAVPFARRGFSVTGVDITPFLMEKARAYAGAEKVQLELVEEDMRNFRRAASFDLALSMLTSFGYFDDERENLTVLENIYASLKPGGVFIFDTYGKEIIARVFQATSSQKLPGGGLIVQRREVSGGWSQMENEWLVIKEGQVRTFLLRHWLYSGHEFNQLLTAAGFSDIQLYGNLDGKPYGPEAARLIAVARRA